MQTNYFNNPFGWIDFSRKDKKNAISVITANSQEILDELGLGIIRDAFSNYFFPGITTAQTRAKYFLLVPYILYEFSLNPKNINQSLPAFYDDADKKLKDTEKKNAEKILEFYKQKNISVDNLQIIGTVTLNSGRFVTNVPRNIYWNGLNTFEIIAHKDKNARRENVTFHDYLDAVWYGHEDIHSEDDSDEKTAKKQEYYFLPDIEDVYKTDWKTNCNIDLTKDEAVYLKRKILSANRPIYGSTLPVSESLLATILKDDTIELSNINYIHDLSHYLEDNNQVSIDIKERLKFADYFNDFYQLVMKRYYYLLSGRKDELDYTDEDFKMMELTISRLILSELDNLMFKNAKQTKTLHTALEFLRSIKKDFTKIIEANNDSKKIVALLEQLDKDIVYHESKIKRGKAKLIKKEPDVSITKKSVQALTYRISHVKTIVNDIREAMND